MMQSWNKIYSLECLILNVLEHNFRKIEQDNHTFLRIGLNLKVPLAAQKQKNPKYLQQVNHQHSKMAPSYWLSLDLKTEGVTLQHTVIFLLEILQQCCVAQLQIMLRSDSNEDYQISTQNMRIECPQLTQTQIRADFGVEKGRKTRRRQGTGLDTNLSSKRFQHNIYRDLFRKINKSHLFKQICRPLTLYNQSIKNKQKQTTEEQTKNTFSSCFLKYVTFAVKHIMQSGESEGLCEFLKQIELGYEKMIFQKDAQIIGKQTKCQGKDKGRDRIEYNKLGILKIRQIINFICRDHQHKLEINLEQLIYRLRNAGSIYRSKHTNNQYEDYLLFEKVVLSQQHGQPRSQFHHQSNHNHKDINNLRHSRILDEQMSEKIMVLQKCQFVQQHFMDIEQFLVLDSM